MRTAFSERRFQILAVGWVSDGDSIIRDPRVIIAIAGCQHWRETEAARERCLCFFVVKAGVVPATTVLNCGWFFFRPHRDKTITQSAIAGRTKRPEKPSTGRIGV